MSTFPEQTSSLPLSQRGAGTHPVPPAVRRRGPRDGRDPATGDSTALGPGHRRRQDHAKA